MRMTFDALVPSSAALDAASDLRSAKISFRFTLVHHPFNCKVYVCLNNHDCAHIGVLVTGWGKQLTLLWKELIVIRL